MSVEEAYDCEAVKARQREDTLRQALDKLGSNNSQSHKAQAHAQVYLNGHGQLDTRAICVPVVELLPTFLLCLRKNIITLV